MKIIYFTLLLSLSAIGINAQTPTGAPEASDLAVVEKTWRFQVRNPALDESPFLAIDERLQEEQDIRETAAENRRRARLGINPIKPPVRPRVERKDGPASAIYVYRVKIKNNGKKAVRALSLEYVFSDPETKKEVGRRQFADKEKIAPGKTKTLVFRSVSPPTGTVNASDARSKSRKSYSEEVIIQSIEYADGSKWQAAVKNQ